MARSAGTVRLTFEAGTAGFVADVSKAKAAVKEFHAEMGTHGVSTMQAASGAIRELEGNLEHNIRAVERFMVTTLKLGPVLQAAFPVIGAIAFGGMIVKMGEEVYEFFKDIRTGAERANQAFRDLGAPLRSTNDALAVSNARLETEIAKLEGQHQNTLKIALLEAKEAADKLADSLDKDISSLNKLLKEQSHGWFAQLFGASGAGKEAGKFFGGESGVGGFEGRINQINDVADAEIAAAVKAKDAIAQRAAERKRDTALLKEYGLAVQFVDKKIADAETAAKPHTKTSYSHGEQFETTVPGQDTREDIEVWNAVKNRFLMPEMRRIPLEAEGAGLKRRLESDQAGLANAKLDKPFRDRMAALSAEIEGLKGKLNAAGMSESGKAIASGYAAAVKEIAEVNKVLEEHKGKLTDAQMGQISLKNQQKAALESDIQWADHLAQTTAQIRDRIEVQQMLTDAVGKGFDAQRRANIETQVMQAVGAERYNDPQWMKKHAGDVAGTRAGISSQFDATRGEQSASSIYSLNMELGLQNRLTEAQALGEEEIRKINAQEIIRQGILKGESGGEIVRKVALYYGGIRLEQEKRIEATKAETGYTQELTSTMLDGAEATRKQALENKYAEMLRTGHGGEIGAERAKDEAEQQSRITGKVAERVNFYRDELQVLDQERDKLLEIMRSNGVTVDQQRVLRQLEEDRLGILVQQQLSLRDAQSGVRAFFIEMQRQAKSAAQTIYETLTSAVDRVSDNVARLATGQKTDFRGMVRDLGQGVIRDGAKRGLQYGIGALGKALGFEVPVKRDGSSQAAALWVQIAGAGGSALPGLSKGDSDTVMGGGLLGIMGALIPHAGGGPVSPNSAYLVGERGPEIFMPQSGGSILSNALSQRAMGARGDTHYYTIDARGTDPALVEQRVYRAIKEAHADAVKSSVQATALRSHRVPAGK